MKRYYRNLGGLHICNDEDGKDRFIKNGQIFEEEDSIIAKIQPPGSPIKFQLVDTQGDVKPEVVAPPSGPSQQDEENRAVFEEMTIEELKAYAVANNINLGEARLKKDIVTTIVEAIREE